MAAEWDLRAYRVNHAKLCAFVGSLDRALIKQIIRFADDELADDDRLNPPGLEDALFAIASGKLDAEDAVAYRITTEAILEVLAERMTFDLPLSSGMNDSKGLTEVTTYADRDEISKGLRKVGLSTLAKLWDAPWQPGFPWTKKTTLKKNIVDWPWAMHLDRATLDAATHEITTLFFAPHDLPGKSRRVLWRHRDKDRVLIDLNHKKLFALYMHDNPKRKPMIEVGTLDTVLASVPDEDFEEATTAAAPSKASKPALSPILTKSRAEDISERLVKSLNLDDYDMDMVDIVVGLIAIVCTSNDDPKPSKKKKHDPVFSGTSLILYVDGEQ